jgi:Transposase DDE domain group 1
VIKGRFDGGNMTSNGGVMLLAALDKRLGLMDAAARAIADPREPSSITYSIRGMLRQRVYGLMKGCLGYPTAAGMAHPQDHLPGRLRLLSPEDSQLV